VKEEKATERLQQQLKRLQQRTAELEQAESEHKQAEKALEERANQLQIIGEVSRKVSSILNLDELLSYVIKAIQESFGYYHVDIFLIDQDQGYALFKASSNPTVEKVWKEQKLRFKLGEEGMIGWVSQSGEPLLANDVTKEPLYLPNKSLPETKSELVVPLKVEEQTFGVLDVQSSELDAFNVDDIFVLETLGNQVAIAIENAFLFERIEAALDALQVSKERFALAVQGANDGIWDWDIQKESLYWSPRMKQLLGYADDELDPEFEMLDSLLHPNDREHTKAAIEASLKDGRLYDVDQQMRTKSGEYRWFHARGQVVFDEVGKPVRMVGSTTDVTERKQAEERLHQTLQGIIEALGQITEVRDPYTAGHQKRVTQLSVAIAKEMELSDEQIEGIHVSGLLHDIGKMSIPAEILTKPVQLSEPERALLKDHPKVAYDILKTVDFPWPIDQIVLQHHERMDGSGYPQGLKGKEIMLEARILAVADVIDAMASHRPYRPAFGIDKALEEISDNKGVLYDPGVAETCLRLFNEKGFKFSD